MIKYGFQYLETPSFEYSDSIENFFLIKRDRTQIFSFKDESKWLSLRYDLTAPLARYVARNYLEIPKPLKDINWEQFGEMKNQVQVDLENFNS